MNQNSMVNHLDKETSPYLLQHKNNPVDWYPWGQKALALAKKNNKPILLSIGYSACHWCHVMAHESFEDPEIAALMNKLFVNIKVDREERPDLDKIYQAAHSLLTQRAGGWPLTVFLTPDEQMPFFAGTYFPNTEKHGMPSFPAILSRVADAYSSNQQSIEQQNQAIRDVFSRIHEQASQLSESLSAQPIDIAKNQLKKSFDSQYGGFGSAPKFPHPANLAFTIQQWSHSIKHQQEDFDLLNTATFTLEMMAKGGIFDQLGGGFCRYSVDNYWLIPHFEKMLYDNGSLLALYASAYTIIETPLFEETAIATANWMIQEMQSDAGGFFSSLDADTENVEGKFYVWTADEVRHHIDNREYKYIAEFYGLDKPANFEDQFWHFHQSTSLKSIADKYDTDIHQLHDIILRNKQHLLTIRNQRTRPGTDDKILTSWNALAIKGLSVAGRIFNKTEFVNSAKKALEFIATNMWQNNRLFATHKDGKTQLNAYLDDYAFLLDAIVDLLQAEWCSDYLEFACQLADDLLEHFEHKSCGGFYFTRDDHENLIFRQKNYSDEATPSGNGIATMALMKLGHLLSEPRYIDAAERVLKSAFKSISQSPVSHCTLLQALDIYLNNGFCTVIIRGEASEAEQWQDTLNRTYNARLQHFYIPDTPLPEALASKKITSSTCAYICDDMTCSEPVYTIDSVLQTLK